MLTTNLKSRTINKTLIYLNPDAVDEAKRIAELRNDKPGAINLKFGNGHSDFYVHYLSTLAEIAWSITTKWRVDKEFKYGDGGIDFTHDRKTYDVKARDVNVYENPDLLCRINYAKADRFILAEVDSEKHKVRFVGWCTKDELIENTINISGKGTRYIRYRKDLRTFPESIFW